MLLKKYIQKEDPQVLYKKAEFYKDINKNEKHIHALNFIYRQVLDHRLKVKEDKTGLNLVEVRCNLDLLKVYEMYKRSHGIICAGPDVAYISDSSHYSEHDMDLFISYNVGDIIQPERYYMVNKDMTEWYYLVVLNADDSWMIPFLPWVIEGRTRGNAWTKQCTSITRDPVLGIITDTCPRQSDCFHYKGTTDMMPGYWRISPDDCFAACELKYKDFLSKDFKQIPWDKVLHKTGNTGPTGDKAVSTGLQNSYIDQIALLKQKSEDPNKGKYYTPSKSLLADDLPWVTDEQKDMSKFNP